MHTQLLSGILHLRQVTHITYRYTNGINVHVFYISTPVQKGQWEHGRPGLLVLCVLSVSILITHLIDLQIESIKLVIFTVHSSDLFLYSLCSVLGKHFIISTGHSANKG